MINLKKYLPSLLGCEDIIAESISLDTLIAILKWSSHPYGSKWVHRQALHFLCEEFSQVMTSDVFYELSKDHLLTAIQSDYLQVIIYSLSSHCHPYVHQETHLYSIVLPSREISPLRNALSRFVQQKPSGSLGPSCTLVLIQHCE